MFVDIENNIENDEALMDDDEFNAWHELRLHPLLMNAIYKLGFKQPTPIQKACIPAAVHQGKVCDVCLLYIYKTCLLLVRS